LNLISIERATGG